MKRLIALTMVLAFCMALGCTKLTKAPVEEPTEPEQQMEEMTPPPPPPPPPAAPAAPVEPETESE